MNLKRGKKILDEWKEVHRIRRINQRLYDYLASSIIFLYNIPKNMTLFYLIKIDKIKMIVDESEKIWMKFHQPISNTQMEHPEIQQNQLLLLLFLSKLTN